MITTEVHQVLSWVVIISNGVAGAWALGAHWVPLLRVRALWWAVVAAELTIFAQVGLGVFMLAGQGLVVGRFHVFYGFVAIVAVAILYAYRASLTAWLYLLYGFGGLFLMGLAIRSHVLA